MVVGLSLCCTVLPFSKESIKNKNKQLLLRVRSRSRLRTASSSYFFFFGHRLCLRFLGSYTLFIGSANIDFDKYNFNIRYYGSIYIFKNIFIIVFLVINFQFSVISDIQTDSKYFLF